MDTATLLLKSQVYSNELSFIVEHGIDSSCQQIREIS